MYSSERLNLTQLSSGKVFMNCTISGSKWGIAYLTSLSYWKKKTTPKGKHFVFFLQTGKQTPDVPHNSSGKSLPQKLIYVLTEPMSQWWFCHSKIHFSTESWRQKTHLSLKTLKSYYVLVSRWLLLPEVLLEDMNLRWQLFFHLGCLLSEEKAKKLTQEKFNKIQKRWKQQLLQQPLPPPTEMSS